MPKVKHICFERILPQDLRRAIRFESIGGGQTRAISPIGKLWINGSTLSISFMGGTAAQHNIVKQHANQWTEHANLRFDFTRSANTNIRIAFEDDGAWSYVGTDAKKAPTNEPTMNFGWLDEAVVLHEFGHAIGLAHEHQNPSGGLQWNEQAIIDDLSGPPNHWDEATIRHNVLNKYSHDQINGTEFDPESIMLYSFPADWTLDGFHSNENTELSEMDKAFIAGEKMYPGKVVPLVELPVQELIATAASIGQPSEEDLFVFNAASAGSFTVETEGQTDLVMKLFGPDDQTLLIAEDDDSGQGYNPKINVDLARGRYFVQIRHYNRSRGTGSYGIKVSKT